MTRADAVSGAHECARRLRTRRLRGALIIIHSAGTTRGIARAGCTEQWTGALPPPGSLAGDIREYELHPVRVEAGDG